MTDERPPGTRDDSLGGWEDLRRSAANALRLLRQGRIAAPYSAPYEVAHQSPTYRLRHYTWATTERLDAPHLAEAILLVPPLMITAEVYDISPELSAVQMLRKHGVDPWVVDFGAPEREERGLERTLDDHILAVADAVRRVAAATGHAVHLAGYSQGGMFAYQAAAFLRSEHLASVVTFGSPVDIRRALPVPIHDAVAEKVLQVAKQAADWPLARISGLPGALTRSAFKVLSARREVGQVMELFSLLADEEALARREPKRRFLNGEGFVAWPGPALRQFLEDVVANNRMTRGGLVIQGRPVTLADIEVPVLSFVGLRDDLVQAAAVRGIHKAAPRAEVYEWAVPAGHFGLVVGSVAVSTIWPGVVAWLRWRHGLGELPEGPSRGPGRRRPRKATSLGFYDQSAALLDQLWKRLGDVSAEMGDVLDAMRFEIPRLARLKKLGEEDTPLSLGRSLREQAEAMPDAPFFLWGDRAWSWREVDLRVDRLVHALAEAGVRTGDVVALLSGNHPDLLALIGACNRLGAIAALLPSEARGRSLIHALQTSGAVTLVCSAQRLDRAIATTPRVPVFRFGDSEDPLPLGVVDLETLGAPDRGLPEGIRLDQGQPGDVALLLFTSGTTGLPKAARITNRRWATAALGAAAACRLTPADTVLVTLPLQHATGLLLGVGGAIMGGCRLALSPRFSAQTFWPYVRRHGVTVVFYVGEMLRFLVQQPSETGEGYHPVRLFAGNGCRPEVWRALLARFGPLRVLEFYGSTEGNVALANLRGAKIGSVGRPLPGQDEPFLAQLDDDLEQVVRDDQGRVVPATPGEGGLLLARVRDDHPLARFEGYTDPSATENKLVRDVVAQGDLWFNTGDLLRRDDDGDYWFLDRLGDTYRFRGYNVATEEVASVLHEVDGVAEAVVYGITLPDTEGKVGMAAILLHKGASLDTDALAQTLQQHLPNPAHPRFLRVVQRLAKTQTHKQVRRDLVAKGADPRRSKQPIFIRDAATGRYSPLDRETYLALLEGRRAL